MAGVNICIKCSMFIFNFVFWLCGAIILSVAISIRAGKIGQEFFIGLLMILLLQVAAGILATARKSKVCTHIIPDSFGKVHKIDMLPPDMNHLTALFNFQTEQALNKTLLMNARLLSSTNENERVFQEAFSELQEQLKCCGLVNGASDWGSNFQHYYKTCECPRESDSCIKYSGKTIYKQSCFASISHMFSKRLFIVMALAFGLAAIEVLGLIFSIVLYCQMRKK
uniref:Tetraspanin n=1 Tax=Capra hircus TaxID=9925 RepID=A0A452GAI7_CAPHI